LLAFLSIVPQVYPLSFISFRWCASMSFLVFLYFFSFLVSILGLPLSCLQMVYVEHDQVSASRFVFVDQLISNLHTSIILGISSLSSKLGKIRQNLWEWWPFLRCLPKHIKISPPFLNRICHYHIPQVENLLNINFRWNCSTLKFWCVLADILKMATILTIFFWLKSKLISHFLIPFSFLY
jgi:hypothetical protein